MMVVALRVIAVPVLAVLVMVKGGVFVGGSRRMRIDEVPALRRGQMLFQPGHHLWQARAISQICQNKRARAAHLPRIAIHHG